MGILSNAFAIAFYELFMETEEERQIRVKYGRQYRYNHVKPTAPVYNDLQNQVYQLTENVANKVSDVIMEDVLPAVIDNVNSEEIKEQTEYITYTGNTSDYPPDTLELDSEYPIIRLSETVEENNIFGSSVFRFRNNGPKFGSDIRLEPYYKIPIKFYEDKWGEEIIKFTDTLAGYIPLIENARIVSRNPNLYFGLKIYNNPNSFMLSSLNDFGKMTDDVIITVSGEEYDISWRRNLGWDLINTQTV